MRVNETQKHGLTPIDLVMLFICLYLNACAKNTNFDEAYDSQVYSDTNLNSNQIDDLNETAHSSLIKCEGTVKNPHQVKTNYGVIEGKFQGQSLAFLGIPFAVPPVGALRWAKAKPLQSCYPTDFKALTQPPACPQIQNELMIGQEDCLSLNVWVPTSNQNQNQNLKQSNLPVMVFIHGGGNLQGSAGESVQNTVVYDGAHLSEISNSIVVVIQYRLGILGWLSLDDEIVGNDGLSDQIQALRWIKSEISAFGGNPNQITIFGESAGARNVCVLIASPKTKDLFQTAIMQSGACLVPTQAQVQAESKSWLAQTPCASASKNQIKDCLLDQPLSKLFTAKIPQLNIAGKSSNFQPYVDGDFLPQSPIAALENGDFHIKALIVGANQQETSRSVPQITSEAEYHSLINRQFGVLSEQILRKYPVDTQHSPLDRYIEVTSDAKFVCNALRVAQESDPSLDVYHYSFAQILSNAPKLKSFGSYHGIELLFIFQQLHQWGYRPSSHEMKTADQLSKYWTHLGDADFDEVHLHTTDLIKWPRFMDKSETLVFNKDGLKIEKDFKKSFCDFWDQIYVDF